VKLEYISGKKEGIYSSQNWGPNSKIKNIRDLYRGISDLKKGYQPRTNIVKDEQDDFPADSHSILARWAKYFLQLLNVNGINDVRET